LRLAPVYLLFIASPWMDLHRVNIRSGLIDLGACALICIAWYLLLNRYYKRHYGRIESKWDQDRKPFQWFFVLAYGLFAYFAFRGHDLPEQYVLLWVPIFILSEGLSCSNVALRRSYYIVGSAIFLSTLLPALIRSMLGHRFFYIYDFAFFGSILLILSILDHILLTHSFHHVPGENHV
jgi:hypothetical protein